MLPLLAARKLRQEDWEGSLSYIVRSYFKTNINLVCLKTNDTLPCAPPPICVLHSQ